MKHKSIYLKKIIWAVDVGETDADHEHALYLLGALTRATKAEVHPVYVRRGPHAEAGELMAETSRRLAKICEDCDIATIKPSHVLTEPSSSTRRAARALISYALVSGADAIVVATHARSGVPRMFFGSFAESLAMMSPIPFFTVNPATMVRERLSRILFPTSFYPRFKPAFKQVMELAKSLEAALTIYHKITPPVIDPSELERRLMVEDSERLEDGHEWQSMAQHYGVKTEIHVSQSTDPLSEDLNHFAKEHNFDLVAMASQADEVSCLLIGSVTRNMIITSPCPVWVIKIADSDDLLTGEDVK